MKTKTNDIVIKTCGKVASHIMKTEFHSLGQRIYTQENEYRADFLKAVRHKQKEIMNICYPTNCLSDDFYEYIKNNCQNNQTITRKQFYHIIINYLNYHENVILKNYNNFINDNTSLTPDEFFNIKNKQSGDVVGVYIIHNKTKNMYYIGQAKRLFFRLNRHFTGCGNGDVYADYKHGDDFTIQIIKLTESGYSDIDKLERDLIKKYDAYNSGYNKTNGNK